MTRWSERQRVMLEAMGVRLWQPVPAHAAPTAASAATVAVQTRTQAPAAASEWPVTAAAPAASADGAGRAELPPVRRGAAGAAAAGTVRPPSAAAVRGPAMPAAVPTAVAPPEVALGPAGPPVAPDGAPLGIERMDWAALEQTVAGCVACPLAAGRTRTVFGSGNPRAHWMIVGEAPGEQEDLTGEAFVGQSGKLLDAMLRALQLTRGEAPPERQVYIANTVKCRPPGNRNPQPGELERCAAYLARQIDLVRPRVIVAMGRFAAQALLGSAEPIGKLRGRVHRHAGVPLVATYHPAYLLRNPQEKARSWDDLCLAREAALAAGGAGSVPEGAVSAAAPDATAAAAPSVGPAAAAQAVADGAAGEAGGIGALSTAPPPTPREA